MRWRRMRQSRMKQREYLSKIEYKGNHALILKLPLLIREEGLKKTLKYLDEKDKNLFDIVEEYIKENWDIAIKDDYLNKIEMGFSTYQNITRDIMQLLQEWRYYGCSGKERKDNGIKEKKQEKSDYQKKKFNSLKLIEKQKILIQKMCRQQYNCIENVFENNHRIVIGISEPSVIETSMTLHHLYQIPYIPATAIKGVFHHYCDNMLTQEQKDEYMEKWFGREGKRGEIIFLDAYFENSFIVEDIITPHYYDYYKGNYKENRNSMYKGDRPKIIYYKAVEGGKCTFRLLVKKSQECEKLNEYLKKCFDGYSSIGAKETNGYGFLNLIKEEQKILLK